MQKGEKHGFLTAVKFIKINNNGETSWLFRCHCEKQFIAKCGNVRNGHTKSCGCIVATQNGESVKNKRFYRIWYGMQRRTKVGIHPSSNKWTVAKGVKCEWSDYKSFKKDMYRNYNTHIKKFGERNTTIDRIDNFGNYSKENCRWATYKEQARNTSTNRYIEINGKKQLIIDIAKQIGIKTATLKYRIDNGWDIYNAMNFPIQRR